MSLAALPAEVVAQPAEAASLLAEFHAVEAELGESDDGEEAPEAPARGPDGKFLKGGKTDPAPKPAEAKPSEPTKDDAEGRPTVAERVKFREERRQLRARTAQVEQQAAARIAELEQRVASMSASSVDKLREMLEAADGDGIAKALGRKSWNEVNDHLARAFADPSFRQNQELKSRLERIEAEKAQAEQGWKQRQAAEQREQQMTQANVQVGETLKASADPLLAALAEHDPRFSRGVLNRLIADNDDDIEGAAQEVLKDALAHYEILHKVFGGRPSAKVEAGNSAIPFRAGSKAAPARQVNKHVPRSSATEASPPLDEELTDEEWLALANQEMRSAGNKERQASKQR